MARNKRKHLKDREKMKGIRIAAKKCWWQRKSNLKKCVENALEVAGPSVSYQPPRDKNPDTAVVAGPKPPSGRPSMSCKPQDDLSKRKAADKLARKTQPPRLDKALEKTTANHGLTVKEINPRDVVRSEKTLVCVTWHSSGGSRWLWRSSGFDQNPDRKDRMRPIWLTF